MCGILGLVVNSKIDLIQQMKTLSSAISHRGPDGEGYYSFNGFGLSHRRLSIIDLQGGKQPLCNETEDVWITFNGEIYNYLELRTELLNKGHVFKTNSDTEVIVHAYEEWGVDSIEHLRGMFAFAILDQKKEELLLARDHFGIKPLVYVQAPGLFGFASEIQALRKLRSVDWSLDFAAIDQFLQFQYIPNPRTVYQSVKKLPPAHYMRISKTGEIKELKRYWKLNFVPDHIKTESEWLEGLDEVIRDSVRAHMISDVPFGAFLSGGIDSSTVVGYMSQIMNQPVKTFTIGFDEREFNETSYARQVANKWHTEHFEEIVRPDAMRILPKLVSHYGEPFGDNSSIPTYYVSQLAKKHVTMVLTGDAGDELFGGYESYTTRWCRHFSPVPEHLNFVKKMAYRFLHQMFPSKFPFRTAAITDWLRYLYYTSEATRSNLWKKDIWQELRRPNHESHDFYFAQTINNTHFQKAQYTDFNTYMPDDILTKVDIASMMHSLETRTPLLDIKVVEYASRIPEHFNINKNSGVWQGKLLLKKLCERHFSNDFTYRRKMGFATPIGNWLFNGNNKVYHDVEERLLSSGNELSQVFNQSSIKQMIESRHAGNIWNLLFLQEWLSQNKLN